MSEDSSRPSKLAVLDRLGVAEDPLVGADPVSFLRSLGAAAVGTAKHPTQTVAANVRMLLGTTVRGPRGRRARHRPAERGSRHPGQG